MRAYTKYNTTSEHCDGMINSARQSTTNFIFQFKKLALRGLRNLIKRRRSSQFLREFVIQNVMKAKIATALGAVFILIWTCLAEAQHALKGAPRIGFISSAGGPANQSPQFEAFKRRLGTLGYVEGRNISIDHRYAAGRLDRMPALVDDLVQQKVDVILASNNVVIRAAKKATKTIPIVMISSIDPVEAGYVHSFAQPGGNITGIAWLARDISAKRLELLTQMFPNLSRIGVLWDADGPGPAIAFKEYNAAATGFKLELRSLEVRGPNPDLHGAFQAAKLARLEALIVVTNPLLAQRSKQIFDLAIKHRLPTMTEERRYVNAGGLISYGASLADLYERAADYVADILKGAKAGELPVKVASRFEIFINLRTAEQIGVVIPQTLLVQADKIIK